jgi:hypothetical protein
MRVVGGPVISQGELRCSRTLCRERCGELWYTVLWSFFSAKEPGVIRRKVEHHVCPECAESSGRAVHFQHHVAEVRTIGHGPLADAAA